MERQDIFDKVEEIWDECQSRNIGENEAELDFRETITDWIESLVKKLPLKLVVPSTLIDPTKGINSCAGCLHYHPRQYSGNCSDCNDFNKWQRR